MRSRSRGWRISATANTPGATPLRDGEVDHALARQQAAFVARAEHLVQRVERRGSGPCMPGMSGTRPVALASATISTIVFEPSTNSTSMRGFMLRRVASSTYASGVASILNALFLPLPAATIG